MNRKSHIISKFEKIISLFTKILIFPLIALNLIYLSDGLLWRTYAFFDVLCILMLFRNGKIHSYGFVFLFVADWIYGLRTEQISISEAISNISEASYSIWSVILLVYFFNESKHLTKLSKWLKPLIIINIIFGYLNYHYVIYPYFHRVDPVPTNFNLFNSTVYALLATFNTSFAIMQSLTTKSLKKLILYSGYLLLFFADYATRYQFAFFPQQGAPWSDYAWLSGMGLITFALSMKGGNKDSEHSRLFSARVFLALAFVLISLNTILMAIYGKMLKASDAFEVSFVLFLFYYSWFTANLISFVVSNHFLMIINVLKNATFKTTSKTLSFFSGLEEVGIIIKEYLKIKEENEVLTKKNLKQEQLEALAQLSAQVSHDIRSPLAALEMISGSLDELPEEKRLITRNSINRIRDIANSLLEKNKKHTESSIVPADNHLQNVLLSPLLDTMITEKRQQYRNQVGVLIDYNQTTETYGIFVRVDPLELKRVISNLINNSVEAFPTHEGSVVVQLLQAKENQIEIRISDNGSGIQQEQLSMIGKRGVTFGKNGGSGLGIHHAINTIQGFGGRFLVESEPGIGTSVRIFLKREPAQSWFVPKIKLKENQTVIVFDDDLSIHQIWSDRLDEHKNKSNLKVYHFSSPDELRQVHLSKNIHVEDALFLMDYEIIGASETGLDLIESLGIHKHAILVTSRYEEEKVRERCKKNGVRLIPKAMSGFVPIDFV